MSKEKLLIAVYGSLRRGMGNHPLLRDSELLSTETIQDNFKMVDIGAYPGLIESEEINEIVIEVYEVTPEVYRRIESLESYPHYYDRRDVTTTEGRVGIYFLPNKSGWSASDRLVEKTDGAYDWCAYYRKKSSFYEKSR